MLSDVGALRKVSYSLHSPYSGLPLESRNVWEEHKIQFSFPVHFSHTFCHPKDCCNGIADINDSYVLVELPSKTEWKI